MINIALILVLTRSYLQPQKQVDQTFTKLPSDHPVFARLFELLVGKPRNIGCWFGLAEQAINTIYALAETPDVICTSIIQSLTTYTFESNGASETEEESPPAETVQCDSDTLGRLLFILGHVALKQLIHLENAQAEIHRRRQSPSTQTTGPVFSLSLKFSASHLLLLHSL